MNMNREGRDGVPGQREETGAVRIFWEGSSASLPVSAWDCEPASPR
jgi:hypothetical protein